MTEHEELVDLRAKYAALTVAAQEHLTWLDAGVEAWGKFGESNHAQDIGLAHFKEAEKLRTALSVTAEQVRERIAREIDRYCGYADVGKGATKPWKQWVSDFRDRLLAAIGGA